MTNILPFPDQTAITVIGIDPKGDQVSVKVSRGIADGWGLSEGQVITCQTSFLMLMQTSISEMRARLDKLGVEHD